MGSSCSLCNKSAGTTKNIIKISNNNQPSSSRGNLHVIIKTKI